MRPMVVLQTIEYKWFYIIPSSPRYYTLPYTTTTTTHVPNILRSTRHTLSCSCHIHNPLPPSHSITHITHTHPFTLTIHTTHTHPSHSLPPSTLPQPFTTHTLSIPTYLGYTGQSHPHTLDSRLPPPSVTPPITEGFVFHK